MTPSELATEAIIAANKVGQDRVGTATIISRGKRLYARKRLSVHQRFKGVFFRTSVTFTLTTTNLYAPTPTAMVAPILVEKAIFSGANPEYSPVRLMDKGAPDAYFGWQQIVSGGVRVIQFSQAGQAAGDYRLTYLEVHAPADGDQMVLPDGYEDVLVAELGAWLRGCYEESTRDLYEEASRLEDEADTYLRGWNGHHPIPGLTNG